MSLGRVGVLIGLLACGAPGDEATDGPAHPVETAGPGAFTLVVLPDTQFYTLGRPWLLDEMTSWIVANREAEDVAFVLQEGDVTHNNTDEEWVNADASFGMLDGVVPYTVCVGNHDMVDTTSRDTTRFNGWFGPERWEAGATWGGSRLDHTADDHFHRFRAGGVDWLVLSLVYDPPDDTLAWAREVVESYPDHRVIVLTHAYLAPSGTRDTPGERIWSKLVRRYTTMTMVLNGHYIGGEGSHRVVTGNGGNAVAEVFANYQQLDLGGGGRMRLMRIDPDAGTIAVRTCNPFGACFDDPVNQFTLEGLDLGPVGG